MEGRLEGGREGGLERGREGWKKEGRKEGRFGGRKVVIQYLYFRECDKVTRFITMSLFI